MENKYFNQALSNFIHDMASGDAIRHLADLGYSVDRIAKELSFPTPKEKIAQTVWEHYVAQGIILLEEPAEAPVIEKTSYIKEYDNFGRANFRKVTVSVEHSPKKYYPCDFGRQRYKNEAAFLASLEVLDKEEKDYILGLPWTLYRVYHVDNNRMRHIMEKLGVSCIEP